MSCGLCALGPPNQGGLPSPEKKYKRADLAGGDRFWAGTRTVLQYDISWVFLGLGTWLLTVTGIETLILTLIHPSLYINTHTSISISYCYSYLNIKYIDLSLCGSSLPIHVIHPIPGPWLHANLAAQTNNYMRKRNRQLSFIHLRWSLSPFCLTHADALWWDRMHYGETECLKQRCVHQQVSGSSGWLMLMHFIFKFNWHQWLPRLIFIWAPPRTLGKIQLPCYIIWTGTTTASICEIRILSHEGGVLWGPPTRVVLAGGGHCWPPQHFDGGVKFVPCICTLYCSDSSGCNTRIKVKHQITKLLTKVLRRQRIDLAPRQGGGTILSPQSLIGAGHNYIPIIKLGS